MGTIYPIPVLHGTTVTGKTEFSPCSNPGQSLRPRRQKTAHRFSGIAEKFFLRKQFAAFGLLRRLWKSPNPFAFFLRFRITMIAFMSVHLFDFFQNRKKVMRHKVIIGDGADINKPQHDERGCIFFVKRDASFFAE